MDKVIVAPVEPIAPWLGGKSRLAKTICPIIDNTPHKLYAEPFVGMGGIFFRRKMRPRGEVINDFNGEIINLFRVLNVHYIAFIEYMKWQVTARKEFERHLKSDPSTLTDIQRATRFLYLQKTAFGGKSTGQSYGVCKERPARFDITKLAPMLEDVYERLSSVSLECIDYLEFIKTYDSKDTLFYLDPPYYLCENDYGKNMFSRDEFPKMAESLSNIEGKFIISLNDHPDVRDIFKDFHIRSVETVYSIGKENNKKAGEVLISNYENVFSGEQKGLF